MGRTEKLYQRLDALEVEFHQLLTDEFERVAQGEYSKFLYRHGDRGMPGSGRRYRWRTAHVAQMEALEQEIVALRENLGEDGSESATRLVQEFMSAYEQAGGDWWDGRDRATARALLKRMHDHE